MMKDALHLGTRIYGDPSKLTPATIEKKLAAMRKLGQGINELSDGKITVTTQVVTSNKMIREQMAAFGDQQLVVSDNTATDAMLNAHLDTVPTNHVAGTVSMSTVEADIPMAAKQFVAMTRGYRMANFGIVGTIIESDHDIKFPYYAQFARGVINLTTAHKVFPTTAAWVMDPNIRFSPRTRKGVLGLVTLPDGSTTEAANNESWYDGFRTMLEDRLVGAIISPFLGTRVDQISTPEETALKLMRREGVYTRQSGDILPDYSPDQVRTTVDETLRDKFWFIGLFGQALLSIPTLSQAKLPQPF